MVGNRVFGHTLILCVASALMLAPWGTLRVQPTRLSTVAALEPIQIDEVRTASAVVMPAAGDAGFHEQLVFGWQGTIAIGQVRIAYWAICLCLMLGVLASALNFLRWTRVPSIVLFAGFGFAAACSLVAAIQHLLLGTVGTGPVLAIVCALVGLALSPNDEATEAVAPKVLAESRRQQRRAA